MRTVTIQVTEDQGKLISNALDFYCRIGLGQFNSIREHPSIQKYLWKNKRDEYHDIAEKELTMARNKLFDMKVGLNGSKGIHSNDVDDSVRVAFDIYQVIRNEFWKNDFDRISLLVDSSVHFTSNDKNVNKIKCEIK